MPAFSLHRRTPCYRYSRWKHGDDAPGPTLDASGSLARQSALPLRPPGSPSPLPPRRAAHSAQAQPLRYKQRVNAVTWMSHGAQSGVRAICNRRHESSGPHGSAERRVGTPAGAAAVADRIARMRPFQCAHSMGASSAPLRARAPNAPRRRRCAASAARDGRGLGAPALLSACLAASRAPLPVPCSRTLDSMPPAALHLAACHGRRSGTDSEQLAARAARESPVARASADQLSECLQWPEGRRRWLT